MATRLNETEKWQAAKFPYDCASCSVCATGHAYDQCDLPEHEEMRVAAKKQKLTDLGRLDTAPRVMRTAFLSFRKKFARFYPSGRGSK